MTSDVRQQVFAITEHIADARNQLAEIDKHIQILSRPNDFSHIGVGIATEHISFGQLGGQYKEILQEPLLKLKYLERAKWEEELDRAIEELSHLFEKETDGYLAVQKAAEKPWYPDTPGWTWYEFSADSKLPLGFPVETLSQKERDWKAWKSKPRGVDYWCWENVVAYATKD